MRAGVRAEDATGLVDDLADRGRARAGDPLDEARVVAVGDEADLLRLGLVGVGKAEPARDRADLILVHLAERELDVLEIVGRRREEKIGLVLFGIRGARDANVT